MEGVGEDLGVAEAVTRSVVKTRFATVWFFRIVLKRNSVRDTYFGIKALFFLKRLSTSGRVVNLLFFVLFLGRLPHDFMVLLPITTLGKDNMFCDTLCQTTERNIVHGNANGRVANQDVLRGAIP